MVERAFHYNQYTLASLLDIEGTLTKVSTKAIEEVLTRIELDGCVIRKTRIG